MDSPQRAFGNPKENGNICLGEAKVPGIGGGDTPPRLGNIAGGGGLLFPIPPATSKNCSAYFVLTPI